MYAHWQEYKVSSPWLYLSSLQKNLSIGVHGFYI